MKLRKHEKYTLELTAEDAQHLEDSIVYSELLDETGTWPDEQRAELVAFRHKLQLALTELLT